MYLMANKCYLGVRCENKRYLLLLIRESQTEVEPCIKGTSTTCEHYPPIALQSVSYGKKPGTSCIAKICVDASCIDAVSRRKLTRCRNTSTLEMGDGRHEAELAPCHIEGSSHPLETVATFTTRRVSLLITVLILHLPCRFDNRLLVTAGASTDESNYSGDVTCRLRGPMAFLLRNFEIQCAWIWEGVSPKFIRQRILRCV